MKTIAYYIFIFFLFPLVLILPVKLHSQQLSFKLYNVNDGLPGSSTYEAYQDKNGYLWICSPNGISRYDGRQFVNYSLSDGLPSLRTNTVFQDSSGRLWVGCVAGMAQFRNNRFITYPTNDHLDNIYVFRFFETKDKQLWALTSKGTYQFSDSVWNKLSLYPGYQNSICRSIVEFDGELYLNTPNDIVYKSKSGKWLHIASSQDYHSDFNVMSVQNHEIWVSTVKNIFIIRNHQLVPLFKKKLTTSSYFSYFIDSKNRLWLESENFLQVSKPGDWLHSSFSKISENGYPSSINEDANHNVWIGTIAGLLKIKDISYSIIDKNNSARINEIYNLIALPGNKLLLSCGHKNGLV